MVRRVWKANHQPDSCCSRSNAYSRVLQRRRGGIWHRVRRALGSLGGRNRRVSGRRVSGGFPLLHGRSGACRRGVRFRLGSQARGLRELGYSSHVVQPQGHLDDIAWLELGVLVHDDAFTAALALSDDRKVLLEFVSAHELRPGSRV
jgi:hypothetical protein